jgi:hypothetical protein
LEQEQVALPETVQVEMLRLSETIGELLLVASPGSESAPVPVLVRRPELVEVL